MNPIETFSLAGKVALVTGSTRGIGNAIARGYAQVGAHVWVHGRDAEAGERLAHDINGVFVQADLAQPADVQRLARTLLAAETRLDVLVHCAGLEILMPLEQARMDVFDQIWQVNVRTAVELTQLLLPLLKAPQGASIINVTSIHDQVPYPGNFAYSMSKAALAMFTKTMALDLASYQIRVNSLAPGAVATDLNREVLATIGHDAFRQWIPLGRVAQPDEMVGPAIFLASAAASYITGATLYADGGYMQHLVRYRPEA